MDRSSEGTDAEEFVGLPTTLNKMHAFALSVMLQKEDCLALSLLLLFFLFTDANSLFPDVLLNLENVFSLPAFCLSVVFI